MREWIGTGWNDGVLFPVEQARQALRREAGRHAEFFLIEIERRGEVCSREGR